MLRRCLVAPWMVHRTMRFSARTFAVGVADGMDSVRSVVCEEFGEPDVMKVGTKNLPALGEGQVLVKMKAAGVNPSDTYMRLGPMGPWAATPHLLPALPFTPGKDGAGTIEAVGAGVDVNRFGGKNRVYTLGSVTGTYADYAICNANDVFPLPDNVSFAQGACVGVPNGTAYRALRIRCPVQAGDQVFIHGASGAVGIAATQLAKHDGAFVVGSAGSAGGVEVIKAAGADGAVDRTDDDYLSNAVALSSDGEGFDICLEMMASSNLSADFSIMKPHGRIGIIGSRAETIDVNPRQIMAKEIDVRGIFNPVTTPEERQQTHKGIYDLMAAGTMVPIVGMEVALADAPTAHDEVMNPSSGGAAGNIVVLID